MNFETARHNMIEQQIRPWKIIDQNALDAMEQLPRESFVPGELKASAFTDMELPIGCGQVMLSPIMEGKILQYTEIKKSDKVLEIGTGSGYLTGLLALLSEHVYTVEIHPELSQSANEKLDGEELNNISYIVADASSGFDQHGPFDVIILTGSVPVLPLSFQQSLKPGGRLFAVVGEAPAMEAQLITRLDNNQFVTENLFETVIPALENSQKPPAFQF